MLTVEPVTKTLPAQQLIFESLLLCLHLMNLTYFVFNGHLTDILEPLLCAQPVVYRASPWRKCELSLMSRKEKEKRDMKMRPRQRS